VTTLAAFANTVAPGASSHLHWPLALAEAAPEHGSLTLQLLVILGAAAAVATIFQRLKLEAIPGYLVAGILIGPGVLGLAGDADMIEQISSVAVVLLMFSIGLALDVSSMQKGLVHVVGVAVAGTLAFAATVWAALMVAGLAAPVALLMGLVLSLSSTAVFVRVVAMRRELRTTHARIGLGINIVQDLFAVVVLAVIPGIARWAGVESATSGGETAFSTLPPWLETILRGAVGLSGVALMLVFGRFVLPRVLALVASTGSGELVLICSGALAFGAAGLTRLLGFSPEMGAFLAGFLLASTPFRHQLSGMLAPMRDLLMAVFFVAVGMKVDGATLLNDWWIIALGAAGLLAAKVVVMGVAGWVAGMTARSAFVMAVYLGAAGEFALVALAAGADVGVVPARLQGEAIAAVIVTLIAVPLLVKPAHRVAARLDRVPMSPWIRSRALHDVAPIDAGDTTQDGEGVGAGGGEGGGAGGESTAAAHAPRQRRRRIIIAGFGPVGRTLADRFAVRGIDVTVIELNQRTVQRQSSLGRRVVYGDVTNPEVLESAGVQHADGVLITIPDEAAMLRAVQAVRATVPGIFIAVRTNFLSTAFQAQQLGADIATVEEVATAMAMERDVIAALEKRCAGDGTAGSTPDATT
jgi:Kef-type K+ transport system membrane component KefB/predicted dinucleotide-binding enzyme